MPGARAHDFITITTMAAIDVALLARYPSIPLRPLYWFSGAYLFAGFACAGDLDIHSKEYRRWGPLRFLWWPYRVLVPHRSWISHGLVTGGLIRALYLVSMVLLLSWAAVWVWNSCGLNVDPNLVTQVEERSLWQIMRTHPKETGAFVAGFVLAGTTHSVADLVTTRLKRYL